MFLQGFFVKSEKTVDYFSDVKQVKWIVFIAKLLHNSTNITNFDTRVHTSTFIDVKNLQVYDNFDSGRLCSSENNEFDYFLKQRLRLFCKKIVKSIVLRTECYH